MGEHSIIKTLKIDLIANRGYPKSILVVVAYRIGNYVRKASRARLSTRIAYLPYAAIYKLVTEWFIGIELPCSTQIGPGIRLIHCVGTVINPHVVLGKNVVIRHGVTIGNRRDDYDCPVIGDNVQIGAGSIIIGQIEIGENSVIGAGSIVVKDVPPNSVVLPSASEIRTKEN